MTKYGLLLSLIISTGAFAQSGGRTMVYRAQSAGPGVVAWASGPTTGAPVLNDPYSATIAIETIQTLPDGNRIVQHLSGTIARDSQGRTRRDTPRPSTETNAPRLVFIQDPVAQTAYALNLTDKTAQKIAMPSASAVVGGGSGAKDEARAVFLQMGSVATSGPEPPLTVSMPDRSRKNEKVSTDDLGSETMEGLLVNGTRTTRTIPAEQIGNAKPITIVTETWTSPDLQTVVYSKTTDPLVGKQIYQLTHINRAEPALSLFTVPSDFKVIDGSDAMVIRRPAPQN